jgi:hypothetical protein
MDVGVSLGANVGSNVGTCVGESLGENVGTSEGRLVGVKVGMTEGVKVGFKVESSVGEALPPNVTAGDGAFVGANVGSSLIVEPVTNVVGSGVDGESVPFCCCKNRSICDSCGTRRVARASEPVSATTKSATTARDRRGMKVRVMVLACLVLRS